MRAIYKGMLVFSVGGLVGPILWGISRISGLSVALDYIVAMLWPAWMLGTFEYSVGEALAALIAVVANIVLFSAIDAFTFASLSFAWRLTSFVCVIVFLVWLNYWLNNWDVPSMAVSIGFIAILYALTQRAIKTSGSEHSFR